MESCSRCGTACRAGGLECPTCGFSLVQGTAGVLELRLSPRGPDKRGLGWLVQRDEVVIGRGHSADIGLEHDSVSRRHARICPSGNGFLLEDLQSRNWTRLNGNRVTSPVTIAHGDVVAFGDVELVAELEAAALVLDASQMSSAVGGGGETMVVDLDDGLVVAFDQTPGIPVECLTDTLGLANTTAPAVDDTPTTQSIVGLEQVAEAIIDEAAWENVDGESATSDWNEASGAETFQQPFTRLGSIEELLRGAEAAMDWLRGIGAELPDLESRFEQAGGTAALSAVLAQARSTEANPTDIRELVSMGGMAGGAVVFLKLLSDLVDVLFSQQGAAGSESEEAELGSA